MIPIDEPWQPAAEPASPAPAVERPADPPRNVIPLSRARGRRGSRR
ncbi:hypothetical protein [Actinoplanes teichomyceticus]|uniref:Uncharacterized protein n=1 Tax=Actinoplanes teichomyceticus TaxID=1867 RepID=A0A561VKK3_ACTTI|nr:hypothetical protein [Actinoplanes teichomyceticus]TWG12158.1 hypothetical protein FHX34_10525 [Actinoplanes teichomyceticus]